MKIQINTDHNIEGREPLVEKIEKMVGGGLSRFSDRLTRVELHLSDVNGERSGDGTRCVLEVRPNGLDPVVTTDEDDTIDKAVHSAIHKMVSLLDRTFGKLASRTDH